MGSTESAGDIYAGAKGSSFPTSLALTFGTSLRALQYQHSRDVLRAMITKDGGPLEADGFGNPSEYFLNATMDAVEGVREIASLAGWQLLVVEPRYSLCLPLVLDHIFRKLLQLHTRNDNFHNACEICPNKVVVDVVIALAIP